MLPHPSATRQSFYCAITSLQRCSLCRPNRPGTDSICRGGPSGTGSSGAVQLHVSARCIRQRRQHSAQRLRMGNSVSSVGSRNGRFRQEFVVVVPVVVVVVVAVVVATYSNNSSSSNSTSSSSSSSSSSTSTTTTTTTTTATRTGRFAQT